MSRLLAVAMMASKPTLSCSCTATVFSEFFRASASDTLPKYLAPKFLGQYPLQQRGLSMKMSSGLTPRSMAAA